MAVISRVVKLSEVVIFILGSESSTIEPSKSQLTEGLGRPSYAQDKKRSLSGSKIVVSLFIDEPSGGSE